MIPPPPSSTLFPYTRSSDLDHPVAMNAALVAAHGEVDVDGERDVERHALLEKPFDEIRQDRKSTRLNSSHQIISYAVFCLKKKKKQRKESYDIEDKLRYVQS